MTARSTSPTKCRPGTEVSKAGLSTGAPSVVLIAAPQRRFKKCQPIEIDTVAGSSNHMIGRDMLHAVIAAHRQIEFVIARFGGDNFVRGQKRHFADHPALEPPCAGRRMGRRQNMPAPRPRQHEEGARHIRNKTGCASPAPAPIPDAAAAAGETDFPRGPDSSRPPAHGRATAHWRLAHAAAPRLRDRIVRVRSRSRRGRQNSAKSR